MKRLAILQSNYLPWKGYFDVIASVDEFVFFDDVQYTRNDWRNRNKIKTPKGLQWIKVPVESCGEHPPPIREVHIEGDAWVDKHRLAFQAAYATAPYFDETMRWLMPVLEAGHSHISALNRAVVAAVCERLDIRTKLSCSWDYVLATGKTERLVQLCVDAGATEYVSGPAAKVYLDESLFAARGITVRWFDYAGYPEYPQLWGPFEHRVSVVDLLVHCGPSARRYLLAGRA